MKNKKKINKKEKKEINDDKIKTKEISNSLFITILFAVIVSWILIQLWVTAIEAFFYSYMGLSRTSAWVTFSIAMLFTIIFIFYALCSGEAGNTIKSNLIGIVANTASVATPIITERNLIPT